MCYLSRCGCHLAHVIDDCPHALAKQAVDLVTPRRSNQLPPPKREQHLYKRHRIIETTFFCLDRLGLSDRPYRSNIDLVSHVYTTILAFQLKATLEAVFQGWLSRIKVFLNYLEELFFVHRFCLRWNSDS